MIIRFAGFGGQGIVLSSYILGQSAAFDGKKAVQNQAYGSESRGGECRGDVIISDREIYELEPDRQDLLVAMTQPAYEKFVSLLRPGGCLIVEQDLVRRSPEKEPRDIEIYGIRATDLAFKKFGRKIVANMIFLGFMNELKRLVSKESLARSISANVPAGTEELNLNAMREGAAIARKEAQKPPNSSPAKKSRKA